MAIRTLVPETATSGALPASLGSKTLAAALHKYQSPLISLLSVIFFLALWQVSGSLGANTHLFPPPTRVLHALWTMLAHQHFINDILASSRRLLVGYIVGATMGLLVGVLTARSKVASSLLGPVIQMLRPIPPISLVPIAIFWFGLGEFAKYFLVFWGVFFPVWINTHMGVTNVDQIYVRAAQCLGAGPVQLLSTVVLPGALPMILAGLRTAIPIAFYTLVAAEIAGAYSGVAYQVDVAQLNLRLGQMFAGLVVLGLMSFIADRLFVRITRALFPWSYT